MRMDVKLGVVTSLIVVLVAGGYYVYRDKREKPIPVEGSDSAVTVQRPKAKSDTFNDKAKDSGRGADTRNRSANRQTPKTADAGRKNTTHADRSATRRPSNNVTPVQRALKSPDRGATGVGRAKRANAQPDPDQVAQKERSQKRPDRATPRRSTRTKPATPAVDRHRSAALEAKKVSGGPTESPADRSQANDREGKERPPSVSSPRRARPVPTGRATRSQVANNRTNSEKAVEKSASHVAVDIHKVQPGDTPASLAKMYYGDEKFTGFVMASNPQIEDPRRLRVGMTIKLPSVERETSPSRAASATPGAEPGTPGSGDGKSYVVQPGDTFYGIARDQLGNASRWQELFDMNKSVVDGNPTRLRPGQVIKLPSA